MNELRFDNGWLGLRFCLDDIWGAAGGPADREPVFWLSVEESRLWIAFVGGMYAKFNMTPMVPLPDPHRQTLWAHWLVAMDYAKFLGHPVYRTIESMVLTHGGDARLFAAYGIGHSDTELEWKLGLLNQGMQGLRNKLDIMETQTGEHFNIIEGRLEVATRRRRNITDSTKKDVAWVTAQLGGKCPCCEEAKVVDERGNVLSKSRNGSIRPSAEFDHFITVQNADLDNVWLICTPCHHNLTHGRIPRYDKINQFQKYQINRRAVAP